MDPTFVFFHAGADSEVPSMLVDSIRRSNVTATVIQCSDLTSPVVSGVTRVERFDGNPANLMTYRLSAFSRLALNTPAIYLDTDMLVQRTVDPAVLLGDRDVLLCRRDFDRDLFHSGSQRGVHFPEHRGKPLGEVYPYLACATITRDSSFWSELLLVIGSLDERFHRWYGDQEAMRRWVETSDLLNVGFLPETDFACLPDRSHDLSKAAHILHFKGGQRKALMKRDYQNLVAESNEGEEKVAPSVAQSRAHITYVIMTPPPNTKSAGITYLNSLADYLRAIGRHVIQLFAVYPGEHLHVWGSTDIPTHNHWVTPWSGHWVKCEPGQLAKVFEGQSVIVIHGENQHFKWFEGLNVVRYYLHTIGGLQKLGVPREGEFKLAWHPMFCANADHFLSKSMVRADLDAARLMSLNDRSLDLTYIGKASLRNPNARRLKDTVELTRNWPSNDDEYFYLLSKARYLFTYDAATSVIDDAIIMGAMPILMGTEPFSREEWEKNLDPAIVGCYAFYGDDYEVGLVSFGKNRNNFVSASVEKNAQFFESLQQFCLKAEHRFFG